MVDTGPLIDNNHEGTESRWRLMVPQGSGYFTVLLDEHAESMVDKLVREKNTTHNKSHIINKPAYCNGFGITIISYILLQPWTLPY